MTTCYGRGSNPSDSPQADSISPAFVSGSPWHPHPGGPARETDGSARNDQASVSRTAGMALRSDQAERDRKGHCWRLGGPWEVPDRIPTRDSRLMFPVEESARFSLSVARRAKTLRALLRFAAAEAATLLPRNQGYSSRFLNSLPLRRGTTRLVVGCSP